MELRLTSEIELDLLPEYCHYHDAGCVFADSCLNCPLPMCVHDEPGGRQRLLKRWRAEEMDRLFINEGKSTKELADIFGVSLRTVQRIIKAIRKDKAASEVLEDD